MIVAATPAGRASNAVGSGPRLTPPDCNCQVARITTIVPKAMRSPWEKLAKRSMPYTSVTPSAPKAICEP